MLRSAPAVGVILLSLLVACGGGKTPTTPQTVKYSVGGTVTGLVGSVVLTNGAEQLTVSANGRFEFVTPLPVGTVFEVSVVTQPANGLCFVFHGRGTASSGIDVTVTCGSGALSLGVVVSGLVGSLNLRSSTGDQLVISGNGSYAFPTRVSFGSTYGVTVSLQPVGQTCTIIGGTGLMTTDVLDVTVRCSTSIYTISGTVTGLAGSMTLTNSGTETLTVTTDGSFTFKVPVTHGTSYEVVVSNQPTQIACTVSQGSGVATGPVTNVVVTCSPATFAVSGYVSWLSGSVDLQNSGGETITVSASGPFTFPTPMAYGQPYNVTVLHQPASQTCSVSSPRGWAGHSSWGVQVYCAATAHFIGGMVTGLIGSVTLQNSGGDDLVLSSDGPFVFPAMVATGAAYEVRVTASPLGQTCSVARGLGWTSADVSDIVVACSAVSHSIGGTVSGLQGASLTVHNNDGQHVTVNTDGPFTFGARVASGHPYQVWVVTQPTGKFCRVTNGTGVATADVTDITVHCVPVYSIGGNVSGLVGSISLENAGSLTGVSANGPFTLDARVPAGDSYEVSILYPPPSQLCDITNGSGIALADVADIAISCHDAYTVYVCVSGLSSTVSLQNNGTDTVVRSADGCFQFPTRLLVGASYAVTVSSQPAGQTCTVQLASGTATSSVYLNVLCSGLTHTIGGSISGLIGTVSLQNNAGDTLVRSVDGAFTFPTSVADGATYAVTVSTQPAGQGCDVVKGTGTARADVSDVSVVCASTFTVGGTIAGLTGTVTLQNNDGDTLVRTTNGAFTFATAVTSGSHYAVTVSSQPAGQICSVTQGSGTITADVTNVAIDCVDESVGLDATFGSGGIAQVSLSSTLDVINGIALQSDGKIVAASAIAGADGDIDFAVTRFNSDGTLDTSFAAGGTFVDGSSLGIGSAAAVALQSDGKIVAVGTGPESGMPRMSVVRLGTSGALDTTFAGTGKLLLAVPGRGVYDVARAVAIQADSKIVVGGQSFTTNAAPVLLRLNGDGTVDTSFGTAGFALPSVSTGNAGIEGLALQSDGRIVAVGFADRAASTQSALVARLTTTGALDTTFNATGFSLDTSSSLQMSAAGIALDAAGQAVSCGATQETSSRGFVSRRTTTGTLDTTFDTDGWQFVDASASAADSVYEIVVQSDGKVVVVGASGNAMLVSRYTAAGALDTSFDGDGIGLYSTGTGSSVVNALVVQPDGKYVAAGYTSDGTVLHSTLIRLSP